MAFLGFFLSPLMRRIAPFLAGLALLAGLLWWAQREGYQKAVTERLRGNAEARERADEIERGITDDDLLRGVWTGPR